MNVSQHASKQSKMSLSTEEQFPEEEEASEVPKEEPSLVSEDSSSYEAQRESRNSLSFMKKRQTYDILFDHELVTPYNLPDSTHLLMDEVYTHAVFESRKANLRAAKSGVAFSPSFIEKTGENVGIEIYATTLNLDDIHIDYTVDTEAGVAIDEALLDPAPSAFYLPMMRPPTSYPPEYTITLKETDTVFLYALPCFSSEKGTPEANDIEIENENYLFMTVGKGRNRKTIMTETQTQQTIKQSRHTMAKKPKKKNGSCFASVWDMLDTYASKALEKEVEEDDEMVLYQTAPASLLRKKSKIMEENLSEEEQFIQIFKNPRFTDALVLVERVLASNLFVKQQKCYRGLEPFNPLSLDLKYIYSVRVLWVFKCDEVAGRAILNVSFNPVNEDIIAIAYGKFLFAEKTTGVICVWCTKNPRKPERIYKFKHSATAIAFSTLNPNWLACGFENGDILILDITSYEKRITAKSKRETNPCFTPVWTIMWWADKKIEFVMATCQDGRINRLTSTKTHEMICSPMMRITQVEGKIRGLQTVQTSLETDVPIIRHPAALCCSRHPTSADIYYVGTDEGCIHMCSTNYLNMYISVLRAHIGPVYNISFNPFWESIMATCGADWAIRLWMEGINEPLVTMKCLSPVYCIAWSPANSTILASVSGNLLSIWDIRRKSHIASCEHAFAQTSTLTYVTFGSTGENMIVGDTEGELWTLHLEDMPIAPFYQKPILQDAVAKVLSTRPNIAKQVEKIKRLKATQAV